MYSSHMCTFSQSLNEKANKAIGNELARLIEADKQLATAVKQSAGVFECKVSGLPCRSNDVIASLIIQAFAVCIFPEVFLF